MPDVVTLGSATLTGTWSNGAQVRTFELGGWGGSPGSSLTLTQKPRSPGAWASPRQAKERILTPTGSVAAPDRDTLRDTLDLLDAAAALDPQLLVVTEGALTRSLMVLRQDEIVATVQSATYAEWSMQLVAPDPRKFAAAVTTSPTSLPQTTGGLQLPFTLPNTIPASVITGQSFVTNPGNATGPVTLRITGPVTAPIVTHVSSRGQLAFATNLAIAAGDWIDVDMEAQTVLLRGQASRSGYVTQRGWFGLDPGPNTFAFTASTGDVGASLTVTATPAWL